MLTTVDVKEAVTQQTTRSSWAPQFSERKLLLFIGDATIIAVTGWLAFQLQLWFTGF